MAAASLSCRDDYNNQTYKIVSFFRIIHFFYHCTILCPISEIRLLIIILIFEQH